MLDSLQGGMTGDGGIEQFLDSVPLGDNPPGIP